MTATSCSKKAPFRKGAPLRRPDEAVTRAQADRGRLGDCGRMLSYSRLAGLGTQARRLLINLFGCLLEQDQSPVGYSEYAMVTLARYTMQRQKSMNQTCDERPPRYCIGAISLEVVREQQLDDLLRNYSSEGSDSRAFSGSVVWCCDTGPRAGDCCGRGGEVPLQHRRMCEEQERNKHAPDAYSNLSTNMLLPAAAKKSKR
ncbi:hypothetical protein BJV78DRAFT_1221909 [Lactifluus subvellereus]|nr:hypothetical protein BJV78DRAFT_1221909 [Lactifluus subvellereus]